MILQTPLNFQYDIYIIGADGPQGTSGPPGRDGQTGADGANASCNWASVCTDKCYDGGTGTGGVAGGNGTPQPTDPPINGSDVRPATITIGQLTGSDLWVFSAGGNGGVAGNGGNGGIGGTGGKGGDGASCPAGHPCPSCKGGTGGTGGNGGNGGVSGNGGNGATINLTYSSTGFGVNTTNPPSIGGKQPVGGAAGAGGVGGSPGGNAGAGGSGGSAGTAGNQGFPSTINVSKR